MCQLSWYKEIYLIIPTKAKCVQADRDDNDETKKIEIGMFE